jgi:hypothetical protein
MEPNAETANPAYRFPNPPGRDAMSLPASIIPMDFVPADACCTVLIVSNGASIVLEHAAARPDARVLLRPSTRADDDDVDDEGGGDDDPDAVIDNDEEDEDDVNFANAAVVADADIDLPRRRRTTPPTPRGTMTPRPSGVG